MSITKPSAKHNKDCSSSLLRQELKEMRNTKANHRTPQRAVWNAQTLPFRFAREVQQFEQQGVHMRWQDMCQVDVHGRGIRGICRIAQQIGPRSHASHLAPRPRSVRFCGGAGGVRSLFGLGGRME